MPICDSVIVAPSDTISHSVKTHPGSSKSRIQAYSCIRNIILCSFRGLCGAKLVATENKTSLPRFCTALRLFAQLHAARKHFNYYFNVMVRLGWVFRGSLRGCLCAVGLVRICLMFINSASTRTFAAFHVKDTYIPMTAVLIRVCSKIRFCSSRQAVTFRGQIRTSPTAHTQPRSESRNAQAERTITF
jgi:hypothetical protein